MLRRSLFVGLFALGRLVTAMSIEGHKICANEPPSAEYIASIQDVIENEKNGNFTAFTEDVMVDMYIHVVANSEKPDDGYISVRSAVLSTGCYFCFRFPIQRVFKRNRVRNRLIK